MRGTPDLACEGTWPHIATAGAPRLMRQNNTLPTAPAPHGGLRTFHQKSIHPEPISFEALCGATMVTFPANTWGNKNLVHHRVGADNSLVRGSETRARLEEVSGGC